METKMTLSAGGVVLNAKGEVLVVNQKGDSWSLPKGHVDLGEDALAAARRETYEESGITDLTFVRELGTYERYRIAKGGVGEDKSELKQIKMFLFTTNQEDLKPVDPDNPEARWAPPAEVEVLLTHPKDKAFFILIAPDLFGGSKVETPTFEDLQSAAKRERWDYVETYVGEFTNATYVAWAVEELRKNKQQNRNIRDLAATILDRSKLSISAADTEALRTVMADKMEYHIVRYRIAIALYQRDKSLPDVRAMVQEAANDPDVGPEAKVALES